jgi:hypothetical protein
VENFHSYIRDGTRCWFILSEKLFLRQRIKREDLLTRFPQWNKKLLNGLKLDKNVKSG